ncbi:xanthine dehydrogenase family protein molybdopterin-binding subunit [Streptomyces sp. TS71-3]|uniref:xanthine dehydrogenase family protein molybdopterin-binding subunit n=1 Tax=Streptomyces sp. TS71-3 TaxID=2733862 RepID=UPI001B192697|nr:xanthine dehydrogenase family protein molybdopterin-binding subunit [Streptomyces sp. TS71-3]GHJ42081.1 oxidoreductase [Streptomyces sp. TS71-3]
MSTSTLTHTLGAPVTRLDGYAKVTGEAQYAYEYPVEGVVYVFPAVATVARGRVTHVDAAAVLGRPGVLAVLDHTNAPKLKSGVDADLMVLQSPDVAYRGQIVAGVVATSLEAARAAAEALPVTYEEEPHEVLLRDDDSVFSPELLNGMIPASLQLGDPDAAIAAADVVVDAQYTTPAEHAMPMEPHATIAVWDEERLTLYDANQGPFGHAETLAALFGIDSSAVEIVAEYVGGAFGSKGTPRPSVVLTIMAARVVERPAKFAMTRQQMFSLVTHRAPTIQRVRLAAGRDGRLTAVVHDSLNHTSRLKDFGENSTADARMMYASPNIRTVSRLSRLDIPTPGFFRAPGHTPGMFALESAMDELAQALDIDPVELRLRNEPEVDPFTGLEFSSRNLTACLREGAARFDWQYRDPKPASRREGRWLVGTGMASSTHPVYVRPSTAVARAEADGTFLVRVGAMDVGTGARTAMAQVAADALGIPLDRLRLEIGRRSLGMAPLSGGSMGTASWSWAVDKACRALVDKLDAFAGVVPEGGLEVQADTSEDIEGQQELSRHAFGAQFVQLRVDTDTGEIRVDRMLGVFTAGRILNPKTARSQLIGAMTMGLSMALLEIGELDPRFGDFANHDLAGYHYAANADVPAIEAHWLEEQDDRINPVGGKGIGELGIVGAAAALTNAFHHATGVRVRDLPLRIEDARRALRQAPGEQAPAAAR